MGYYFDRRFVALALICGSSAFVRQINAETVNNQSRPNIVMIFTDDQRHDAVGYSGNHAVSTPHLDRLANNGTVFQNCFVNTSICAISRANLLTGQYPSRHGVDDFFKTLDSEQLAASVPGRLQTAGYQTAFYGKWGIGDTPSATHAGASVFDYWAGQPMQTSFFHQPGCRYVDFDGFQRPLDDLCNCPADSRGQVGFRNRIGKYTLENPLHTDADVIPMQVKRFLETRDVSKPFCMMLHFKAPHSPFADWDEEVRNATAGLNMPIPPAATLENANREPAIIKKSLGAPTGRAYLTQDGHLDQHMRNYYRLVSSMDAGVGRVIDAINLSGESSNTVFLFTSDNGHFLAEHGLAEKWLMYEPSLRVPGFVYDPRKPIHLQGQVSTEMVITTDFSVTMLALAGDDRPESMSGRDLMPLIDRSATKWREDFYYEHPYGHGGAIPRTVGVRSEDYCYTRYVDPSPYFEQLFDLIADPNQLNNLATNARHGTKLKELRARCDELAAEVGSKE